MKPTAPEHTQENATFEKFSQEIYLINTDGEQTKIPFETYRSAPQLEWPDFDNGFFIIEQEQAPKYGQPLNLMGPTLTKVLQWNIDSACTPEQIKEHDLKPGYLLDLRSLHLTRMRAFHEQVPLLPPTNKTASEKEDEKTAKDHQHKTMPIPLINVPEQYRVQLTQLPKDANLYIISWQNPADVHPYFSIGKSQMNYLSGEKIRASQDCKEEIQQKVADYLSNYYDKTNSQVGTLNPLDSEINPTTVHNKLVQVEIAITCYVANLKSFC